jgi:CheY-like chemotaxis protein
VSNADDDLNEENGLPAVENERRYETGPAAEAPPSWRILVAEDNPLNQQLLARQLATLGFSCDIVADGREAFRGVISGRYDVVLMDLQIPLLDGLGATRLIRQWEKEHGAPPVRIVAVTADGSATDRFRSLKSGMDDHLAKPLRIAELSSVLNRLLNSSSSPAPLETNALEEHPDLDHSMIEGLRALGEDDGAFLRGLIRQFRADGDARLARLEQAAKDGETSVIRAVAHALRGSSANIGAVGVTAACRATEGLSMQGDASQYPSAVRRVRAAYERVLRLLDELA